MKLYLVVGQNSYPLGEKSKTWGIIGLFKDSNKAWNCPILDFDSKEVYEIESDFEDEDLEILKGNKKFRMLRIEDEKENSLG